MAQCNDLRDAGNVKRWHTHPTLREQTLAHHMWNVARILLELTDGTCSFDLLYAALTHDLAEIDIGDIPRLPYDKRLHYPRQVEIRKELSKIEEEILEERLMKHVGKIAELSQEDQRLLKFADLLEAIEFLIDEYMLGNRKINADFSDGIQQLEAIIFDIQTPILKQRATSKVLNLKKKCPELFSSVPRQENIS